MKDKSMVIDAETLISALVLFIEPIEMMEVEINEKHIYNMIKNIVEVPTCYFSERTKIFNCRVWQKHIQAIAFNNFRIDIYEHTPSAENIKDICPVYYSIKIVKL